MLIGGVAAKLAANTGVVWGIRQSNLDPEYNKRATLWMQDLVLDVEDIDYRLRTLPFRGVKGTTGTQASFLEIFDGDHPHTPRGCVAQAWSVAELLRAAVEDIHKSESIKVATVARASAH